MMFMALTKEYLDGISFDTVKQKYYNANKVNACLEELIAGAKELIDENERLRKELAEADSARAEIADALLSAKQTAANIVSNASDEAKRLVDDATREAEELKLSAYKEHCIANSPLSERQLAAIEDFNKQLDSFNVSHATQIFRLKQALLKIAADEA